MDSKQDYILNTRPGAKGHALRKKLSAAHIPTIWLPALEIISFPSAIFEQALANQAKPDVAIFTSVHAVNEALLSAMPSLQLVPTIAIGQATYAALIQAGWQQAFLPAEFSSEGILAMPIFNTIIDKKIYLFSGEGGRTVLEHSLRKKGAQVYKIPCYRRQCPTVSMQQVTQLLLNKTISIVLLTSEESLNNLKKILGTYLDTLYYSSYWCVVSERLKAALLKSGCPKEVRVCKPDEELLARYLIDWYKELQHE